MAQDNFTSQTGNVTRDVELRYTPGGQTVASFGLAVNRRWQNRQTQEWEEAVSFFDVTVWGQTAENTAASINKGDRVTVIGRLEQETWDDKETGDKRSKVKIVADDISLSLRWIKVTAVEKNEKSEQSTGRQQASRPATGRGSAASGSRPSAPAQDYAEEPF